MATRPSHLPTSSRYENQIHFLAVGTLNERSLSHSHEALDERKDPLIGDLLCPQLLVKTVIPHVPLIDSGGHYFADHAGGSCHTNVLSGDHPLPSLGVRGEVKGVRKVEAA